MRRQLTLFLPEPQRSVIDAIRQRHDPAQHALIAAHVTLCRDDELPAELPERLPTGKLTLRFEAPRRLDDGCVLIPFVATARFDALRRRILGDACRTSMPHITLLHPRNAAGKEGALEAIACAPLPETVTLREISLIERRDGAQWEICRTFP